MSTTDISFLAGGIIAIGGIMTGVGLTRKKHWMTGIGIVLVLVGIFS